MVSIPTTWSFLAFIVSPAPSSHEQSSSGFFQRSGACEASQASRGSRCERSRICGGGWRAPEPVETSTPGLVEGAPQEGAAVPLVGAPEPQTAPPESLLVDSTEETIPAPPRALTPHRAATPPREAVLLRTLPSPRAATPPPASPSQGSPAAPAPPCEGATEASAGASAATGGGAASPPLEGATEVPAGASAAAGGGASSPPRPAGEDEHPRDPSAVAEAIVAESGATPSPRARPGAGFSGPAAAAGPSSSQEMVLRS